MHKVRLLAQNFLGPALCGEIYNSEIRGSRDLYNVSQSKILNFGFAARKLNISCHRNNDECALVLMKNFIRRSLMD